MTTLILVGAALVVGIALAIFILPARQKSKLLREIRKNFGAIPPIARGLTGAGTYWATLRAAGEAQGAVDDLTWHDLDMDEVFIRINSCGSAVGDARLYAVLRSPEGKDGSGARDIIGERESLAGLFKRDTALRERAQLLLYTLGRTGGAWMNLPHLEPQALALPHHGLLRFCAFLPLIALLLVFLDWKLCIAGVIAAVVTNLVLSYRVRIKQERGYGAVRYLASCIRCTRELAALLRPHAPEAAERLAAAAAPFSSLSGSLTMLDIDTFFADSAGLPCPFAPFLLPVLSYGKLAVRLVGMRGEVGALYRELGEVDLAACLLSFRASLPLWCRPEFIEERCAACEDLWHPLLEDPVPNSATFDNDTLVTGSNASGKSTFLKALAVNCILAQTLNTCTARAFRMRRGGVATSMAVTDSVVEGDSYFVAEIKSMRRLLRLAQSGFCYCFIDEILKGTNTVERVAAAAAVVRWLHGQDCLCFAATHDAELTAILAGECGNIHFTETVNKQGGVGFDYRLRQGPATSRNAILLLQRMGFPKEITGEAEELVEGFEQTGKWAQGAHSSNSLQ